MNVEDGARQYLLMFSRESAGLESFMSLMSLVEARGRVCMAMCLELAPW